jgi:hypothetical protein
MWMGGFDGLLFRNRPNLSLTNVDGAQIDATG